MMKFVDKKFLGGFISGFLFFPVLFSILTLLYSKVVLHNTGELTPPDLPNKPTINLDWNVTTLDGKLVNLGKTAKGKLLFINFWGTWCPSCIKEMQSIEKLYGIFGERVVFARVSAEETKKLKEFASARVLRVPLYKMYGAPPPGLETRGVPATFIISGDEKLLLKHIGAADWSHKDVIKHIEKLLEENIKE
jgi:thiol-disulfide isomerase/thioredoxin